MAGLPLNEIAKKIGFSHDGSVSDSVAKFDRQVNENFTSTSSRINAQSRKYN